MGLSIASFGEDYSIWGGLQKPSQRAYHRLKSDGAKSIELARENIKKLKGDKKKCLPIQFVII
jgi:hypothetical protein